MCPHIAADTNTWTKIRDMDPPLGVGVCGAHDFLENDVYLWGGLALSSASTKLHVVRDGKVEEVSTLGTPPATRTAHVCTYIPPSGSIISSINGTATGSKGYFMISGGLQAPTLLSMQQNQPPASGDFYLFDIASTAWFQWNLPETARPGSSAVYDPFTEHVLLVGGAVGEAQATSITTVDLASGAQDAARIGSLPINFDPATDMGVDLSWLGERASFSNRWLWKERRMIYFGGIVEQKTEPKKILYNDAFQLRLRTAAKYTLKQLMDRWQLTPTATATPSATATPTASATPSASMPPGASPHPISASAAISVSGPAPPGRVGSTAVFNERMQAAVVYGGRTGMLPHMPTALQGSTQALHLKDGKPDKWVLLRPGLLMGAASASADNSSSSSSTQIKRGGVTWRRSHPGGRANHIAAYDLQHDAMYVWGGEVYAEDKQPEAPMGAARRLQTIPDAGCPAITTCTNTFAVCTGAGATGGDTCSCLSAYKSCVDSATCSMEIIKTTYVQRVQQQCAAASCTCAGGSGSGTTGTGTGNGSSAGGLCPKLSKCSTDTQACVTERPQEVCTCMQRQVTCLEQNECENSNVQLAMINGAVQQCSAASCSCPVSSESGSGSGSTGTATPMPAATARATLAASPAAMASSTPTVSMTPSASPSSTPLPRADAGLYMFDFRSNAWWQASGSPPSDVVGPAPRAGAGAAFNHIDRSWIIVGGVVHKTAAMAGNTALTGAWADWRLASPDTWVLNIGA